MGKQEKRKWRLPELTTKAKILFGLGIAVFVGALLVFATSAILRQIALGGAQDYKFETMSADERKKEARDAAIKAVVAGDDSEADAIYKQVLGAEPDGTKKVELAIDYSRTLSSSNQADKAVKVAEDALGYSDDKFRITDWLARLYAKVGRYDDAKSYYEKARDLVASPTNIGKYSKEYYTLRAADMKARAEKQ